MSTNQDQARLIAERVARRLGAESPPIERAASISNNSADLPVENRRARIVDFVSAAAPPRIEPSISSSTTARVETRGEAPVTNENAKTFFYPQVVQSPWLAPFAHTSSVASPARTGNLQSEIRNPQLASHPSQEKFGVEEAAVSELVEFFENEKQCTVDPSGKPCDHCAMCSSRGF